MFIILVSKRLENLQDLERVPRIYMKRNAEYWETTIKEKRAPLRQTMRTPAGDAAGDEDDEVTRMTPPEIRAKLKNMGLTTKTRNVKRLQELY